MEHLPQKNPINLPAFGTCLTNREKIIVSHSLPRVSQMGQNHEPIKLALIYVFDLIGLKELRRPDDRETFVLVTYIREKMPHYTAADFKIAFEMAISGELKLEKMDINHFQTFNSAYLAKVMNAYRAYKRSVICQHERDLLNAKFDEKRKVSDQEKKIIEDRFFKENVVNEFEKFKETGNLNTLLVSARYVYDVMERRGFINITSPQKHAIYNEIKSKEVEVKKLKRGTLKVIGDVLDEQEENTVKNKCCLKVIFDTFTKMKNESKSF